ncbi:TMEM165/GDT1 family protein [Halorhabdus sp. CBA1104]|uniref:TMEM165/GDT1 family protein n=1 Tax=unclassified Halorhabdus TaxID=2621901 RepID=UPI0012B3714D|nr:MULTISPECIES: TMEM165/GDT1 family protein [unclassified Halorhabdus]QGN05878.1 TMEM165/GDT1 family protein [Halorhabdus sp. CBA1104]
MSEYLEILVVAFAFQLSVLPGEKVQLIIAGLSTRYHPLVVVSAAGSAFAGWTALEILFGNAIKTALPELYLDAFTVGLFLLFAVLLIRSMPAPDAESVTTDGGVTAMGDLDVSILGVSVPPLLGGWVPIFVMMAAGEFGDKTQLITIDLAAQYGATSAIWVGEMLAIIPISLLNAYVFHRFAHLVNLRKAHLAGAAIFVFFAADTVLAVTVDVSVWETIVEGASSLVLALG